VSKVTAAIADLLRTVQSCPTGPRRVNGDLDRDGIGYREVTAQQNVARRPRGRGRNRVRKPTRAK
jgi:hypothetical protein